MNKTLRISFALKNTYRVNSILYALKQIPLIKKLLPDALYRVWGLKVFANVLSVIWEILSVFLGKLIYFSTMIFGLGMLFENVPKDQVVLHIFLFLSLIGAFANTSMFNPSRDKYYAMILMRMDAREYTLVNYGYSILKVIVGFLPFSILFGRMSGLSLWLCVLLPFSVAGMKLSVAAYSLWDYEAHASAYNENKLGKLLWVMIVVFLAAAYGLPALGVALPFKVSIVLLVVCTISGLIGIRKILSFRKYQELNKELLYQSMSQMDALAEQTKKNTEKTISTDRSITSDKSGFEYLNELFIKRHQKILWKATKKISFVCIVLILAVLFFLYKIPEIRETANALPLNYLPYFTFIMYMINRGTDFTRALFMNCDHSLLHYSFYKQPAFILKLFRIRLREIMKVNAVPALIIGIGLALILYVSGGTENPLNYAVILVSILCMSMFFSVHYLTLYYLLQPYNEGTEMKSGMYQIITTGTYLVCYFMMQMKMSTLIFGAMMIAFCVVYSIAACVLVYRFAPKTFRFRM